MSREAPDSLEPISPELTQVFVPPQGTESLDAGHASSCAGCPNQEACQTAPKGPDPDLAAVKDRLKDVKHKILVLSGKGGVGKSTVSGMLGWALSRDEETQVGPTVPRGKQQARSLQTDQMPTDRAHGH